MLEYDKDQEDKLLKALILGKLQQAYKLRNWHKIYLDCAVSKDDFSWMIFEQNSM